jgi:hypothetical protein
MHRGDLAEAHYITPTSNLESIGRRGILSHRNAEKVAHESVAMPEVQDKRAKVVVPGGRPLHEYANLYINARNPMLYKRLGEHTRIVVLRISPSVIDIADAVVTDQNAASGWARFAPAPQGLAVVDEALTFAEFWTHPNQIEQWRHSSRMCAEILVPDRVPPGYVLGAYAMSKDIAQRVEDEHDWLHVKSNPKLFFK